MQVKNGVDCIKIAMDGTLTRENGELIAAFTQEETSAMVEEAHRLGRRVVVHARGREAVLYSARAGVDLIFHAYHLDDECIEAMLKSGSAIGPTMAVGSACWNGAASPTSSRSTGRHSTTSRSCKTSSASAMCISPGSGCTSRHAATTHVRSPTEASATGPTSTRRSVSGRSDQTGCISAQRLSSRTGTSAGSTSDCFGSARYLGRPESAAETSGCSKP